MNMKLSLGFLLSLLFSISSANAAVVLASSPLQTGGEVPANIMFILDDSGSMEWEYIPDSIGGFKGGSTRDGACNKWDKWGNCTRYTQIRYGDDVSYRWYYAAQENAMYYDPAISYTVPKKSNGTTSWGNSTFTSAWKDGFDRSSTENLTKAFSHSGYTYEEAFYYVYTTSLASCASVAAADKSRSNSCYKYVPASSMTSTDKTNFANWYSYYRTRMLASKSGISAAFHAQDGKMRVGYSTINKSSIYKGVQPFNGTHRTGFFDWLFGVNGNSGTPLRKALDIAGQYYSTKTPWRTDPSDSSSDMLSCRQSFTILMTDGYWNGDAAGTSAAQNNNDGTDGEVLVSGKGKTYQYKAASPFSDGDSNTLADVAMYYWKRDLMPDIENNVATTEGVAPAFWQHMRVYGVGLGVEGNVDPVAAMEKISSGAAQTWGSPFTDGSPEKIDDLLHAAVNTRGGFFSARKPTEFADKLATTLKSIADGVASASNLAGTTTSTQANSYVYQGSYNGSNWSGNLKGYDVNNPAVVLWTSSFPAWGSRNILFNGGTGVKALTWGNLSATEQTALKSQNIVNYLRGERTNEAPAAGNLRKRAGVMGDISNSSPFYVAEPVNRNFSNHSWSGASKYSKFIADNKTRAPRIYVGANDGLMHAFDGKTGVETFAYMPKQMLTASTNLASYADPFYEHKYFVDGSPLAADVYIDDAWKTILVGSLGRGGNSLFAMDVTNPTSFSAGNVLWDKSFSALGTITTKPVITRLNNGSWAIVVGYGYNNTTSNSGLLVIDIKTGNVLASIVAPDTVDANAHGLGQVEGWDADRDGTTDWFFAGDLLGNIWKFDLSSTSPAEWKVAYSGFPLYKAKNAANQAQAVTGGLTLSSEPATGQLWVFFGTGKMLAAADTTNAEVQTWYGLKDVSGITDRSQLKQRVMTNVTYTAGEESRGARSIPEATENDMDGKKGWYIDLIDTKERIVSKPVQVGNSLVVNTVIPSGDDCNPAGDGFVLAIDPFKGSRLNYHFFDLSKDSKFDGDDGLGEGETKVAASGVKFDGMPSEPVFFEDKMAVGLATANIAVEGYNAGIRRGRVSWRELSN